MNEKIFNILNEIDVVQESALDTQLDVLYACDAAYNKYCMISESYEGDVDELGLFTEGAIGDEMKKMKGDNENAAVSILMALPRFIAALIKVITKKNEKTEKNFKEITSKKNEGKVAKIVKGIINEQDETKKKRLVAQIAKLFAGIGLVSVATTGVAGLVLHIKPKKKESATGETLKTSVNSTGFEFCITENGTIAMTKEFVDKYNEILTETCALIEKDWAGKITEEESKKLHDLQVKLKELESIKTEYDGQNAKELKLTGLYDWYNRANTLLISIKDMADKVGKAAIDKAGDNKITGTMAKVFDHVIRAAASFVNSVLWMLTFIGEAILTLITSGFRVVKNLFSKNPIIKEEKDKADKDKKDAEEKKDSDEKKDSGEEIEEVTEESSVEEVPEGEKVTQESVTETEPAEESEPEYTDPVASSWYNK